MTDDSDHDLIAGAAADYICFEVVEDIAAPRRPAPPADAPLFGYGDRPSRAWLRTGRQFVLLKARDGAVNVAAVSLATALLAEAERLVAAANHGAYEALMLRGLELRGPRPAVAYFDLIATREGAKPYLDLRAIQRTLEARRWPCGADHVDLIVRAQPVAGGESIAPLDDSYYERVRLAMGW
jgi:hypothetical protein